MNISTRTIRALVSRFPAVVPHLTGKARWIAYTADVGPLYDKKDGGFYIPGSIAYNEWLRLRDIKSVEFFQRTLERMVANVYNNQIAGEFIDLLANLISGQLTQAFEQAWTDEGDEGDLPPYLADALEEMILNQYEHVDQYYRDIVDARIDQTPIDPLLSRAADWAGQWDVAYREAVRLIQLQNGGNMVWRKGETESGCSTCASLDGIVMSAREWQELDVHPRGYPNPKLECEGGGPANHCDCTLEPTDQRRSPKAYSMVIDIVSK